MNKGSLKMDLIDYIENQFACSLFASKNHILLPAYINLGFLDKFPVLQIVQVTKNPG